MLPTAVGTTCPLEKQLQQNTTCINKTKCMQRFATYISIWMHFPTLSYLWLLSPVIRRIIGKPQRRPEDKAVVVIKYPAIPNSIPLTLSPSRAEVANPSKFRLLSSHNSFLTFKYCWSVWFGQLCRDGFSSSQPGARVAQGRAVCQTIKIMVCWIWTARNCLSGSHTWM